MADADHLDCDVRYADQVRRIRIDLPDLPEPETKAFYKKYTGNESPTNEEFIDAVTLELSKYLGRAVELVIRSVTDSAYFEEINSTVQDSITITDIS